MSTQIQSEKVEFEVGTVDNLVAFNIKCKVPLEFPIVLTLKIEEASGIIAAIATAIQTVKTKQTQGE